jgi:hypothetical protein
METMSETYPDIGDLIARKREGRLAAAKRTFAEKIAWLEMARRDLAPFAALREERRRARETARGVQESAPGQ